MNKLNEEILAKFLMGECTDDELREVNAWLEESGENARWRRFTTWGDWGILRIHKT